MLRLISLIAVLVTAVGVAVWSWSAWWLLLAIFIHSSFEVSSGPSFDRVMTANREGDLSVFPRALLNHMIHGAIIAAIPYGIASIFNCTGFSVLTVAGFITGSWKDIAVGQERLFQGTETSLCTTQMHKSHLARGKRGSEEEGEIGKSGD